MSCWHPLCPYSFCFSLCIWKSALGIWWFRRPEAYLGMPFGLLDILFYSPQNDNSYPYSSQQRWKKALSVADHYPNEGPPVYKDNFCGLSEGCDLPAGFSDEGNRSLRIMFSWGVLSAAQLDIMMWNLTRTVHHITCSTARAIRAKLTSSDSLGHVDLNNSHPWLCAHSPGRSLCHSQYLLLDLNQYFIPGTTRNIQTLSSW